MKPEVLPKTSEIPEARPKVIMHIFCILLGATTCGTTI